MALLHHSFWFLVVISSTNGFKHFQDAIPNGNQVPHPCKSNYIWKGVGHENEAGGGTRNPFGLDFFANEKKWTSALCMKDSDGDGKTNGEELGDPDCSWTPGTIPQHQEGLTHPGICEPLDSEICHEKNDFLNCDTNDFECEGIQDQGVENITLRFPTVAVPGKETTYICKSFDIPTNKDYHLIANQPLIDNENIMHHIAIYGCLGDDWALKKEYEDPKECGMATVSCSLIGIWTLGLPGQCFDKMLGFRFGSTSVKFMLMQLHWNNPELRNDYTDSSGLILHYTPNLRPNDAAQLILGVMNLEIPPALPSFPETDTCSSNCTSHINQTMYLTSAYIHMHYLGISGSLVHYRNGKRLQDLAVDAVYSYDTPVFHGLDNLEFLPGDEFKLECNFSSMSRNETTYYGEDTSAEMCNAFVTYFPAQASFKKCVSFKSNEMCAMGDNGWDPNGCGQDVLSTIFGGLWVACPNYECTENCNATIIAAKKHECMQDLEFVQDLFEHVGQSATFDLLRSCDRYNILANAQTSDHYTGMLWLFIPILLFLIQ